MGNSVKDKRKKAGNGEKLLRVKEVVELFLSGYQFSYILNNCIQKWGVSEQTAKHYIRDGYDLIREDVIKDIAVNVAFHVNIRFENYRILKCELKKVIADQDISPAYRIQCIVALSKQMKEYLQDIAKINGLYVERFDITGDIKTTEYKLPDGNVIKI